MQLSFRPSIFIFRYLPIFRTFSASPHAGPKLPQIPSVFQTRIELNIVDKNTTVDVLQYFDYDGNRVRIDTLKDAIQGSIIYSFDTAEIFYVTSE